MSHSRAGVWVGTAGTYPLSWHLRNLGTDELIYKTETDSQTYTTNLLLSKGKGVGEG